MARPRMVTRTIITTNAEVLMVNVQTKEVFEKSVTISGEFDDQDVVEKKAAKVLNSAESKVIAVKTFTRNEALYGMDEQDFIAQARILPPRDANDSDTEDAPVAPNEEPKKSAKKH